MNEVKRTTLFRTSTSWDGAQLPHYPNQQPEIVAIRLEFPPGKKLHWHHHPVINFGFVQQGDLTIIAEDGTERTFHQGEYLVEMVNTIHCGENRGHTPVVLIMFYLTHKNQPVTLPK